MIHEILSETLSFMEFFALQQSSSEDGMNRKSKIRNLYIYIYIIEYIYIYIIEYSKIRNLSIYIEVSKVGDCSRGKPEGSLFNSYYTEV